MRPVSIGTCGIPSIAAFGSPGRSAIERIGEACRLTPTEVRVLRAVVEVGGIRDTAAALSISPTTVKTHLRHIFQKTGVKGQIDLIRLVARTTSRSDS
jgi:DNA-binding CsgD family transcriptional regulator